MYASDLAEILNDLGYKTDEGKKYTVGTRGIYGCLGAAYRSFVRKDENNERAGWIARTFVTKDGKRPWELEADT